ncbi:transmembrane protein 151B-like [Parasteatoda tepidariorum]|uniref:transmembrane protein 151B-like n=1 Tax=Parasteatoda tepidariorum TaxID=114398 RepID=UPI00077F9C40|nr:transmembrane protein 151B-like [Parasteatoda tepidariorum]
MSVGVNEDLEEQRPQKQGLCRSLRRDAHIKCLVLTLLILGCMGALVWCQCARVTRLVVNFHSFPITTRRTASPCEEGYVFIPVAFMAMLYLVYLVECWHCTTRLELAYKVDAATVYEHIQQMRETQPVIWWKAVCYHYVRRTRHVTRYRNGDAYTTTQVYYERVNSHGSGASFTYTNCGVKDISKKLLDLEKHPATKIRFSKGFAFANLEAANEFDEQRRRFFHENERLDDYMEMCEGLDLVGVNFQEHMVAFAEPHRLPWYVSHMIFWIFSLALLSWPLRVLIQYKTAYVHYQVNKLFGVNYLTPSSEAQMIGHMSRGTTIDSSEFERQITNNNTIAPSYSESLLLRSSSSFMERNRVQHIVPDLNPPPSRSASTRRFSTGIPVSISRSSLQNGRVVYYVSPLEEVNNENHVTRRERTGDDPSENAVVPPPSYDDALRHCRPLFLPLRRSVTDRDIQRRLPLVFVHYPNQRDTIPLGEDIEENEPETATETNTPETATATTTPEIAQTSL